MAKAEFIRARIEPEVKREAEVILKTLGLTISEAINLFYTQVILHRGLPFAVKLPNAETARVFQDTDSGRNLTEWASAEDFFTAMHKRSQAE